MSNKQLKTRIAPTPSGFMHPGNAFNFILTALVARQAGGRLLLRIDDADRDRFRAEYMRDIFVCLDGLGLEIDEGPTGPTDFMRNFSQKNRYGLYEDLLADLQTKSHVFPCSCSRKVLKINSETGLHSGTCLVPPVPGDCALRIGVPAGESVVFRDEIGGEISVDLAGEIGDFIVRRREGVPAYQIVSLFEDERAGVNCIVRGADLKVSTAAQLFLARQAGMEAFGETVFWHHPLLKMASGEKLSKSAGAESVSEILKTNAGRRSIYRFVARNLGLTEAPENFKELAELFRPKTAADFLRGNNLTN